MSFKSKPKLTARDRVKSNQQQSANDSKDITDCSLAADDVGSSSTYPASATNESFTQSTHNKVQPVDAVATASAALLPKSNQPITASNHQDEIVIGSSDDDDDDDQTNTTAKSFNSIFTKQPNHDKIKKKIKVSASKPKVRNERSITNKNSGSGRNKFKKTPTSSKLQQDVKPLLSFFAQPKRETDTHTNNKPTIKQTLCFDDDKSSANDAVETATADDNETVFKFEDDDHIVDQQQIKSENADFQHNSKIEHAKRENCADAFLNNKDISLNQACTNKPELKDEFEPQQSQANQGNQSQFNQDPLDIHQFVTNYNEPVSYLFLSRYLWEVNSITGRIKIVNLLTMLYWHLIETSPQSLLSAVYLCTTHLAPPYENCQLNTGPSLVSNSLLQATGISAKQLSNDMRKTGDLGSSAYNFKVKTATLVQPKPLMINNVYQTILGLGKIQGKNSNNERKNVITKLLSACREREIIYIVRSCLLDMRIGISILSVIAALAKAVVLHAHYQSQEVAHADTVKNEASGYIKLIDKITGQTTRKNTYCTWDRVSNLKDFSTPDLLVLANTTDMKSHSVIQKLNLNSIRSVILQAQKLVRLCYSQRPNMSDIVPAILSHPLAIMRLFDTIHIKVGIPIQNMLGVPSRSVYDLINRFKPEPFSLEVKLDGQRSQVHYNCGSVKIFSRHLMDSSDRNPEIRQYLIDSIKDQHDPTKCNFIIDVELVAIQVKNDDQSGQQNVHILPFQQLTTRKRKVDANDTSFNHTVKVCIYAFDLLFLNDAALIGKPYGERRQLLRSTFTPVFGQFSFIEYIDISAEDSKSVLIPEDAIEEAKAINNGKTKKLNMSKTKARNKADKEKQDNEVDNDQQSASENESDVEELPNEDTKASSELMLIDNQKSASENNQTAAVDDDVTKLNPLDLASKQHGELVVKRISDFLTSVALQQGEGVMAKSLDDQSTYEPDIRTQKWTKLKSDYCGLGTSDSIDVVPIGGWTGTGRKAKWYSPILLAVWNAESETFETLCKCMSGFTDEMYEYMNEWFKPHLIPRPKSYYNISPNMMPTFHFAPSVVWEIRGADLTVSPVHTAAAGLVDVESGRGISLRFPRFMQERHDKKVEDATSTHQLVDMFHKQVRKGGYKS